MGAREGGGRRREQGTRQRRSGGEDVGEEREQEKSKGGSGGRSNPGSWEWEREGRVTEDRSVHEVGKGDERTIEDRRGAKKARG